MLLSLIQFLKLFLISISLFQVQNLCSDLRVFIFTLLIRPFDSFLKSFNQPFISSNFNLFQYFLYNCSKFLRIQYTYLPEIVIKVDIFPFEFPSSYIAQYILLSTIHNALTSPHIPLEPTIPI
jgi:hypothetical protein